MTFSKWNGHRPLYAHFIRDIAYSHAVSCAWDRMVVHRTACAWVIPCSPLSVWFTWTVTKLGLIQLQAFHMRCQRCIMACAGRIMSPTQKSTNAPPNPTSDNTFRPKGMNANWICCSPTSDHSLQYNTEAHPRHIYGSSNITALVKSKGAAAYLEVESA